MLQKYEGIVTINDDLEYGCIKLKKLDIKDNANNVNFILAKDFNIDTEIKVPGENGQIENKPPIFNCRKHNYI